MDNNFANFQNNLRTTAIGVKFGKQLFTDPYSLDPQEITKVLKQLGLAIPEGLLISAQIAQAWSTGATLVESVEQASNASDVYSFSASSANTIKIVSMVGEKNDWFDHDTALALDLGFITARLVGSGGLDVTAWIQLALEVGSENSRQSAVANFLAQKSAIDGYKSMISDQTKKAQEALLSLQKNEIGIFGFLTKLASGGPLLFENVINSNPIFKQKFPGLNFIPIFKQSIQGTGATTVFWGESKRSSFSFDVDTIGNMSEETAFNYLFQYVIEPYTLNYLFAEQFYNQSGRASIFHSAILQVVSGNNYIAPFSHESDKMRLNKITPYDLGDEKIFDNFSQVGQSISGVSIGGIDVIKQFNINQKQAMALNKAGFISVLLKSNAIKKFIDERYTLNYFPDMSTITGTDWRKIENVIACLDFIDSVRLDPYYQTKIKPGMMDRLLAYNAFPHVDDFKKKLNEVYNISMLRKMNVNARANVSYFLNKSPDQVKMFTDYNKLDQPAIFK